MVLSVDINCDLGEGCPNDAELMSLISAANIACGGHAGNAVTMESTVVLAIENNVAIGAHPGYPDAGNFGRVDMDLSFGEIIDMVSAQITELNDICGRLGVGLRHVKPHGALYNRSARDAETAAAIAKAVTLIDSRLVLYGLAGSVSLTEARNAGLRTASEVFADRTYLPDGSLTPRSWPNAIITDPRVAAKCALQMVREGRVIAEDGSPVPIEAETICVHGDGAAALPIAEEIRRSLLNEHIAIRPPADSFDDR